MKDKTSNKKDFVIYIISTFIATFFIIGNYATKTHHPVIYVIMSFQLIFSVRKIVKYIKNKSEELNMNKYLNTIKNRMQEATKGCWEWNCGGLHNEETGEKVLSFMCGDMANINISEENKNFIESSRTDMETLFEVVEYQDAEIEILRKALELACKEIAGKHETGEEKTRIKECYIKHYMKQAEEA